MIVDIGYFGLCLYRGFVGNYIFVRVAFLDGCCEVGYFETRVYESFVFGLGGQYIVEWFSVLIFFVGVVL